MLREPKYFLHDRNLIGKIENGRFYYRDSIRHRWIISSNLNEEYEENRGVFEEIEYDTDTEKILAIRRLDGCWVDKRVIERCKPSAQVQEFIEKSGIKYEDIYKI